MGVVYKAEDTRLKRFVALKFLPDDVAKDPQALSRFQREAQAASALNHPNICTIYDIGEENGQAFIAMEYLEGSTLKHMSRGGRSRLTQLLDLGIQIADALDAAHSSGIVHRDIKPANIFVTQRGHAKFWTSGWPNSLRRGPASWMDRRRRRVADGDQRGSTDDSGHGDGDDRLYVAGAGAGRGAGPAHRSVFVRRRAVRDGDGQAAIFGEHSAVVFEAILNKVPTPPVQLNPGLPPQMEPILNKALEKDRDLRCQSAAELRADLKRLKRDADSARAVDAARSIGQSEPMGKRCREQPCADRASAGGFMPALIVLGFLVLWRPGCWLGKRFWGSSDGERAAVSRDHFSARRNSLRAICARWADHFVQRGLAGKSGGGICRAPGHGGIAFAGLGRAELWQFHPPARWRFLWTAIRWEPG